MELVTKQKLHEQQVKCCVYYLKLAFRDVEVKEEGDLVSISVGDRYEDDAYYLRIDEYTNVSRDNLFESIETNHHEDMNQSVFADGKYFTAPNFLFEEVKTYENVKVLIHMHRF